MRNNTTWYEWYTFLNGHPKTMVSFSDIGQRIWVENCLVLSHFFVSLLGKNCNIVLLFFGFEQPLCVDFLLSL